MVSPGPKRSPGAGRLHTIEEAEEEEDEDEDEDEDDRARSAASARHRGRVVTRSKQEAQRRQCICPIQHKYTKKQRYDGEKKRKNAEQNSNQ